MVEPGSTGEARQGGIQSLMPGAASHGSPGRTVPSGRVYTRISPRAKGGVIPSS